MIKWILSSLRVWLPLGAAITLVAGMVYMTTQQQIRLEGNNPQVQMAEDGAAALGAGQAADGLVPATKVEISQSLAPYLMVFDAGGNQVAGNAVLHGAVPAIPAGILDAVRKNGEDRVTWQPETGVRQALVAAPVNGGAGGFVLAGRSMRELEGLEDSQLLRIELAWAVSMAATLVVAAVVEIPQLKSRLA